jgi:hypothetical protein
MREIDLERVQNVKESNAVYIKAKEKKNQI